ncbi:SpvB/TcaC N-terminal domain-containing protein [Teredinibacter purpureus]|uniref:SpvB/TcaC N-terminal domain-containing protein n=1 Tax=Teredinibacter purpureus TaxID=2731756 RepID=UPI0005F76DC9|nr:SpvB/TcaC N-terminal domain-containing protein [Teredinibacter purpureus]
MPENELCRAVKSFPVNGINRVVAALFSVCLSAFAFGDTLNENAYEVYYGDFNDDGRAGDVYYHRKDTFVLIHGEIAIPLSVANEGSYVVYEGSNGTVTELVLSKSSLGNYTLGELNSDYYFTDTNGDGLPDIVAVALGTSGQSVTLLGSDTGVLTATINERPPENIESPPSARIATSAIVTAEERIAIDKLQSLGGSFRVDESGAATYSIPIVAPAGSAGVAPGISLNYSSMAGNGIAGKGWSLGGFGSISRCRQTLFQDGASKPISWGQTIVFV